MEAKVCLPARATLGEGALWDDQNQVLYWVDIMEGQLHVFVPTTSTDKTYTIGQPVGTVVPRDSGGVMLAVRDGFASFDLETEALRIVANPEGRPPDTRFNDGKCDPAGRFWAGTMTFSGKPCVGSLYRLDADLSVHQMLDGICISNGIVWWENTMYYIDTPKRTVTAFDYDPLTGSLGQSKVVIHTPEDAGWPDGMVLDTEGMLWIAHNGAGYVRRWNPQTAEVLMQIDVPASQVTACAFGGENLDKLYITTATEHMTPEQRNQEPLAGSLFVAEPGVTGLKAYRFGG
ncbi:MAG: SMP-30/gluconolactonase/LRE family protein [Anaerolineae bacterium]|nr:SMP-30/gluconolactonase/LRE family protein [Anaerolineae bacterium]